MEPMTARLPFPGSRTAQQAGCPCPHQDHDHTARTPWWIEPACPVHGDKEHQ